jgi:hypothetical protein
MGFLLALWAALLLLCLPINAWSQQVDYPDLPGISVPNFLLVANAAVQDELRLSHKQRFEVADFVNEVKGIYQGWPRVDWNVRDENAMTEQIMTGRRLGKILRSEQLKRLVQIDLQRRGPAIIHDESVQGRLKLSREQRPRVQRLAEKTELLSVTLRAHFAELDSKDRPKRRKIAQQLMVLYADGNAKVEAELSDEQKMEWRSIRGKPFDLRLLFQSRPIVLD